MQKILIVNPGSTSTKIAMFDGDARLWQEGIEHDPAALRALNTIEAQLPLRLNAIHERLQAHGESLNDLSAVMARGGLLPPLHSGAYEVNEEMLKVLRERPLIHHASNLGAPLGLELAKEAGVRAYIYDPVSVDEMIDLVRITGLKDIIRHAQGHNLNMRAVALRYCKEHTCSYTDASLIVAHLGGGGITLTLHHKGRIIDMISDQDGPFSCERAGALPTYKFARWILDKNESYEQLMRRLQRTGGLIDLIGASDAIEVERRIAAGDAEAQLAYEAMALAISRSIASLATVVDGKVDAILLTGGIAHSKLFTDWIKRRVSFIAPVLLYPGENEMQSLAEGMLRVLNGEEQAMPYSEARDSVLPPEKVYGA